MQLLSSTAWDSGNKADLILARAAITRHLGFSCHADGLLLEASEARAGSKAEHGAPLVDELDSYEALVRDAGEKK